MEQDFMEFRNKVYNLYLEGKYSEALEIAEKAYARFKDEISKTSYWLACLNSVLRKEDKAIEILTNSLNNGVWWSPKLLEGERDLDPVRNREEFKEILKKCSSIFREKQKESKPERLVFYPDKFDRETKYPLFVALHWKGGNAEEFSKYWKFVLKRGYILLVPQSSQLNGTNAYCWDDWEKAKKEVISHIIEIKERHNLIEDSIIIAGASQGASIGIINFALENTSPNIKRFIAVIPSIVDVSFLIPLLKNGIQKGVKGYIIAGEKDNFTKSIKDLYSEMEKAGLQCKLTIVTGLGHDFPPNFDIYLDEALDYVKVK
jgi:predicted esterase